MVPITDAGLKKRVMFFQGTYKFKGSGKMEKDKCLCIF